MDIDYREVRESFVTTSRDILRRSESLLLEMEKNLDAESLTELLRGLHTIKGNAGIFELEAVIQICHILETRIAEIQSSGKLPGHDFIDTALTALDKMQSLTAALNDKNIYNSIEYQTVISKLSDPAASKSAATVVTPESQRTELNWIKNKTKLIKMPEKYFDYAKNRNAYLSFAVVDLADQGSITLREFLGKLQILHREKSLLSFGTLRKENKLAADLPLFLPYYLILCTQEPVTETIQKLKLRALLYQVFRQPEDLQKNNEVASSTEQNVRETHLKVSLNLLNSLIEITGEIVLARNAFVRKAETGKDKAWGIMSKKLSYLVSDLQDKVMRTRLQPLAILFQRFPRLVRETAVVTQKKADLRVYGGDIELDKAIIDEIADPLVHIIRNAVDHGLERAEIRRAQNKDETGLVTLTAAMREGNIVITVADDGSGLNYENIRNTAITRGLISRDSAQAASEQDISEYLFLPGFSTKTEISTVSGRGVGMDVVRNNVRKLGGTVEITGKSGQGTVVSLVIPQTLSILTCLVVESGKSRFVVPQQNIAEVVTIVKDKLRTIQNRQAYELRSRLLPLVQTNELMGFPATASSPVFLVLRTEKYYFGLTVDRILDTEEVVVKPLPQFSQEHQLFAGAAIMGDARIALIIDAAGIGRHANLQVSENDRTTKQVTETRQISANRYLLVKATGRLIAFKIFNNPRIERISPAAIETIIGRKFVNFREEVIPVLSFGFLGDSTVPDAKELCLVILQAGDRKYGLLAAEIVDILPEMPSLRREELSRPEIEGIAIIGDLPVVVLNVAYMLQYAGEKVAENNPEGGA